MESRPELFLMHLTELQAHSEPLYDWQRRVVEQLERGRRKEEGKEKVEERRRCREREREREREKHCSPQDQERSLKAGTNLRFKIFLVPLVFLWVPRCLGLKLQGYCMGNSVLKSGLNV